MCCAKVRNGTYYAFENIYHAGEVKILGSHGFSLTNLQHQCFSMLLKYGAVALWNPHGKNLKMSKIPSIRLSSHFFNVSWSSGSTSEVGSLTMHVLPWSMGFKVSHFDTMPYIWPHSSLPSTHCQSDPLSTSIFLSHNVHSWLQCLFINFLKINIHILNKNDSLFVP